MYFDGKEGMNAQNGKIKLVQNTNARPKKRGKGAVSDKIRTRAGKRRGADRAAGAVGKCMEKDNFSGRKKSF